jgi:hypothetical protein
MENLFITNSTSGDLYELGVFTDGVWSISEFFDVDEFSRVDAEPDDERLRNPVTGQGRA